VLGRSLEERMLEVQVVIERPCLPSRYIGKEPPAREQPRFAIGANLFGTVDDDYVIKNPSLTPLSDVVCGSTLQTQALRQEHTQ
jgi:hypothetical protein